MYNFGICSGPSRILSLYFLHFWCNLPGRFKTIDFVFSEVSSSLLMLIQGPDGQGSQRLPSLVGSCADMQGTSLDALCLLCLALSVPEPLSFKPGRRHRVTKTCLVASVSRADSVNVVQNIYEALNKKTACIL